MRISPHAFAIATVLSVATLAVVIGTPPRAEAFDYVTNGGFESGTEGWRTSYGIQFDIVDAATITPREGTNSARITIGETNPYVALRQTVWSGTPAGTYRVSASVWTTSPRVDIQVNESPALNELFLSSGTATNQWQDVSGVFNIIGLSNIVITVAVHGSGGDTVYIDDVRFEGADPATMTPTATATPQPSNTPPPDATATRTPTGTRTASPTKTPSETPVVAEVSGVLRNGGFEAVSDDGAPANWQKYGGTLNSSDGARTGTHAARLQSDTDSTKWLYQTALIDGGASYKFSAWLRYDDGNVSSAFLRVSWYASGDGTGTAAATIDSTERLSSPSAEYRALTTGAITAPPDAQSARLRIVLAPTSGATATIYADDAVFQSAVPPDAAPIAAGDTSPEAAPANRAREGGDVVPATNNSGARSLSGVTGSSGSEVPHLTINEVLYDPDGTGVDSDGEWVELYNPTGETVSLDGWSLADAVTSVDLPPISVDPRQLVVIAASGSLQSNGSAVFVLGRRIGNGLGNDGDRLLLHDAFGQLVDAVSWGSDTTVLSPTIADVPEGHSIERRYAGDDTDAAADFIDNMHPSPGSAFSVTSAPPSRDVRAAEAPQTLAASERGFAWLPWALAASMSAALLVVMSWRAAPTLVQRLRQHS